MIIFRGLRCKPDAEIGPEGKFLAQLYLLKTSLSLFLSIKAARCCLRW